MTCCCSPVHQQNAGRTCARNFQNLSEHELEQFETIKKKPPQEQNVADVIETLSIVLGGVSVIADKLDGVENTLKGVQSALQDSQVQRLPQLHFCASSSALLLSA